MDLQGAFRSRLLANGAISSLANKIAWGGLPEKTQLPYIRLTKVFPGREWTHDGPNALVNPRVQIDIFGVSSAQSSALAAAVQAEMERLSEVTAGGWTFVPPGTIEIENGPDPEDLSGGGQAYLTIHDYSFFAHPQE